MMKRYLRLAMTATALLTLAVTARAADVPHISGGVGSDEREELRAIARQHPSVPAPDLTSDKATPAFAPHTTHNSRKSAAEILGNLKGITLSSRRRESVEELYVGRWTREPGWQATVHDLPSKLSGGLWHCVFKEVGSGALVLATTVQDISRLRHGDSVTVSGRIRDMSPLEYVGLQDAIVHGDNIPFP